MSRSQQSTAAQSFKSTTDTQRQSILLKTGLTLEYATLGWNVIAVIVLAVAASKARSVALAGFGLDSFIEIFASVVVVWHLKGSDGNRERLALRLIGAAFLTLAAYVIFQAGHLFAMRRRAAPSFLGIVWLAVTVVVMLLLAWGKNVIGRQLGNTVLIAESRVTVIDAYLATAVLIGVALNAILGWWWADPLSGAVIVYYGLKEGAVHWRDGNHEGEM